MCMLNQVLITLFWRKVAYAVFYMQASFETREKDFKTSNQSLEQDINDSKDQIKRLHEQIEYVSIISTFF